jgi:hypothetical protein
MSNCYLTFPTQGLETLTEISLLLPADVGCRSRWEVSCPCSLLVETVGIPGREWFRRALCGKCCSQTVIKEVCGSHSARQKEKFYFCRRCSQREHSEQGVSSVFTSLPFALMGWFGFVIFVNGYLEKEASGEWGPWSRENKKILLGNIHLWASSLRLGHLVINSTSFDHKKLARSSNISHVGM